MALDDDTCTARHGTTRGRHTRERQLLGIEEGPWKHDGHSCGARQLEGRGTFCPRGRQHGDLRPILGDAEPVGGLAVEGDRHPSREPAALDGQLRTPLNRAFSFRETGDVHPDGVARTCRREFQHIRPWHHRASAGAPSNNLAKPLSHQTIATRQPQFLARRDHQLGTGHGDGPCDVLAFRRTIEFVKPDRLAPRGRLQFHGHVERQAHGLRGPHVLLTIGGCTGHHDREGQPDHCEAIRRLISVGGRNGCNGDISVNIDIGEVRRRVEVDGVNPARRRHVGGFHELQ